MAGSHPEGHRRAGGDGAGAVGDGGAVEGPLGAFVVADGALALVVVEGCHRAAPRVERRRHQGTILAIGSSRIPEAPASDSAGISVLITRLGTTASTA